MDERQTQIKEGAGLDESRLNQDFIELLRKWGTPALLVAAIVAFSYYGVQQWEARAVRIVDQAFTDLEMTRASPYSMPRDFSNIADAHGDVRSVGLIARLDAGDGHMRSVVMGILPGYGAMPDGTITDIDGNPLDEENPPQTLLTEDDRTRALSDAEAAYQAVLTASQDDEGKLLFAVSASFGLVAVAETRGDFDSAKSLLESTAVLAERGGFKSHAVIARERIERMGDIEARPMLYATDTLPAEKEIEEPPALIPLPLDAGGQTPTGEGAVEGAGEGDPAGEAAGDPATDPAGEADPANEGGGEETAEKTGEEGGETGGETGGGEEAGGGGGGSPAP